MLRTTTYNTTQGTSQKVSPGWGGVWLGLWGGVGGVRLGGVTCNRVGGALWGSGSWMLCVLGWGFMVVVWVVWGGSSKYRIQAKIV